VNYDIKTEIYHDREYYYITTEGLVLQAKSCLSLPHHPINCYKKYNHKRFYDIVEEMPEGLEEKLK
jgi:hypothetical protein